ncbi:MAG: 4Fe-4S binding protein [Eubacteriales bacterium]|nr:4Fe-4S binding protein [Eubacteriales bacterium]MDD4139185.1 4Fe-4S binding protein [Eubacteriales bacterium]
MANLKRLKIKRNIVQGLALLLGNANLPGFVNGTIYQGPLKRVCLPGLNCYSCPGALGACPIGSLQNGLADPFWRIPFYVLGLLSLFGLVLGRFICGWLCPFGWFQELLHKIRSPKLNLAKSHARLHKTLLWGKTAMLSGLVILTPLLLRVLTGYGIPAFCTYVCPSGTLMAGIPLLSANEGLRGLAGWLFSWKMSVLLAVAVLSVLIYRPFCRYLCPLGAIYGFFNRISLYRISVDPQLCTHCGRCTRQCPMQVPIPYDGNGPECIRCGECAAVCPEGAIRIGFGKHVKEQDQASGLSEKTR